MLINKTYKENQGEFDVAIFDPPFDIWNKIDFVPTAKTYVCFTNFQNRHHVQKLFGNPRFELIWHFKDGRWVSHNMPRHTHEHILIYGDLKNHAYVGEINTNRKPIKKGKGSIGRDKNLGERYYVPRERKMLNSVIEIPRNVGKQLGVWSKPEQLAMMICEWLVNPKDTIWDGFAGSGTFGVCAEKIGAKYYGSEIDAETYNEAKNRLSKNTHQPKLNL